MEMREPHRITMTCLSFRISSQILWNMEGKAGFDLPIYWNSSITMTGLLTKVVSIRALKMTSQLFTSALRRRSLFINSAAFSLNAWRFCVSDSSLAKKNNAFLSLINSEISVVFPTLRRPYSTTRALPFRAYSLCKVSNSDSRSINFSTSSTSLLPILYPRL